MQHRFALIAGLVVLGLHARANAMCDPAYRVGTPSDSHVPTRGALYIRDNGPQIGTHVPREIHTEWKGVAGTVSQVGVSPGVIKLSYEGTSGSELVLENGDRFVLDEAWHVPARAPFALAFKHDVDPGPCTTGDSLGIVLDQVTAAVRVRWTFAGKSSEWIVPADRGYLLQLGMVSCDVTTILPVELEAGGHLELFSIGVDGFEKEVRGVPPFISTANLRADGLQAEAETLAGSPRELPLLIDARLAALVLLLSGVGLAWSLSRGGRGSVPGA